MIKEAIEVGVIVERRILKNPWVDHTWMPVAVLDGAAAATPWTIVSETPKATRYYAGPFRLELFASETCMYRDNLGSRQPNLWVSLRPSRIPPGIRLQLVTADPAEAEALTEPGTDIIEAVPMPSEVRNRLAAFVDAHHIERPFVKRRRDRADIEAMARKPPGAPSKDHEK